VNLDAADRSDVGKGFLHMSPFVLKLPLVGHVLPLAAPASAEIRAGSLNSVRGGNKDLLDFRFGIGFFLSEDEGSHSVPGDNAVYEDHHPVQPSDPLAAECDAVNLKLNNVSFP